MNIIQFEDSGASQGISKCLTRTLGTNTGFQDFYGDIDSELQNVQEAGSDGWGLDRSSYDFFALMEKVDPYIRTQKRHVYFLRPRGFEFRCIKRRMHLTLNVKESVIFCYVKKYWECLVLKPSTHTQLCKT